MNISEEGISEEEDEAPKGLAPPIIINPKGVVQTYDLMKSN